MAELIYKDIGKFFKESRGLWMIWLGLWVGFIASIILNYVDYQTSRLGYELLPTQKYNELEIIIISALPQFVQFMGGWVLLGLVNVGNGSSKVNMTRVVIVLLLVFGAMDVYSDVIFRINGTTDSFFEIGLGVLTTILFFTFGSEFLLAFTSSMLKEVNQEGYEAFRDFLVEIIRVLTNMFKTTLDLLGEVISDTVTVMFTLGGRLIGIWVSFFSNEKPKPATKTAKKTSRTSSRSQSAKTSSRNEGMSLNERLTREASKKKTRPRLPG